MTALRGLWKVARGFASANGLLVASVVGGLVTLASCDWKAERRGRAAVVSEINTQTGTLVNEALEARAAAARPGAAERLRTKSHCRDC